MAVSGLIQTKGKPTNDQMLTMPNYADAIVGALFQRPPGSMQSKTAAKLRLQVIRLFDCNHNGATHPKLLLHL